MDESNRHSGSQDGTQVSLSIEQKDLLQIVERALLQNDLARASAAMHQLRQKSTPELMQLYSRINDQYSRLEKIEQQTELGFRDMDHGLFEQAIPRFEEVLGLCPDHERARAGLQEAKKLRDKKELIARYFLLAESAWNNGDYDAARDRCRDVINLSPGHASATQLLDKVEGWLEKRRQVWHLVQLGERFYADGKLPEAISAWESITGIDASFREGIPLIAKAQAEIDRADQEDAARIILRDAQRYFDNRQYQEAVMLLTEFPKNSSLMIDASLLLRKAQDYIETESLIKAFDRKIRSFLEQGKKDKARQVLELLIQLSPNSKLIPEFQDLLN